MGLWGKSNLTTEDRFIPHPTGCIRRLPLRLTDGVALWDSGLRVWDTVAKYYGNFGLPNYDFPSPFNHDATVAVANGLPLHIVT